MKERKKDRERRKNEGMKERERRKKKKDKKKERKEKNVTQKVLSSICMNIDWDRSGKVIN